MTIWNGVDYDVFSREAVSNLFEPLLSYLLLQGLYFCMKYVVTEVDNI